VKDSQVIETTEMPSKFTKVHRNEMSLEHCTFNVTWKVPITQ